MAERRSSTNRPVILGKISTPRSISSPHGGGGRAKFNNPEERARALDLRFQEAYDSLQEQVHLVASVQASDPQLVLVFEALDEHIDLVGVAEKLGIEILLESEDAVEPDDDYELISEKATNPFIGSCLHAVCANQKSFDSILQLWRVWKRGGALPRGYAKLRDLFSHLKDVRPWGPQDRLGSVDWFEYFDGLIEGQTHALEVELWYRQTEALRTKSEQEVTRLILEAGGHIVTTAVVGQVGYHGIRCEVPTEALKDLASGNYAKIRLVRSSHVMYLRIGGQAMPVEGQPAVPVRINEDEETALPKGRPVLCLFDGVPAVNHPLLRDRVEVFDPDEVESAASVEERRHGTWMSSVAVWGDRSDSLQGPASRPVLVRPVLVPAADTVDRVEELLPDQLVPDLMWRAFRELFEGADGEPPASPDIAIVNISLGDPVSPFDAMMSSWARIIDWLSYEYGVLVIVSAGNHARLDFSPQNVSEVSKIRGENRRRAVLEAMQRHQLDRRLLAPAESINAISVGAFHSDHSGANPIGYTFDPMDGLSSISPISPIGTGYRRSVKPDLLANGGRVLCRQGVAGGTSIDFVGASPYGPGVRVATAANSQETYISGTSPASALVSRQAARICEVVDSLAEDSPLSRRQRACAIKALLVHGTEVPSEAEYAPLVGYTAFGNGVLTRNFADGCESNEAVVLYVGSIGANEELELRFPLPDGLSVRETKRVDATLAWLSPVNWRHRQYRRAALSFVKPAGAIPKLDSPVGIDSNTVARGATTVQHQRWEFEKAFAAGYGSAMSVRVKCFEQAGGLAGERVDFAVALSLWVAPTLGVDVYSEVRSQVEPRVVINTQQ